MSARKSKPGPKRNRGRPPTAQRRENDRKRRQTEREKLREMGMEVVTIIVPEQLALALKAGSSMRRLEALRDYEAEHGDPDTANKARLRVEMARLNRKAEREREVLAQLERMLLAEAERERQAVLSKAEARLRTRSADLSGDAAITAPEAAPAPMRHQIRTEMQRSNPAGIFAPTGTNGTAW